MGILNNLFGSKADPEAVALATKWKALKLYSDRSVEEAARCVFQWKNGEIESKTAFTTCLRLGVKPALELLICSTDVPEFLYLIQQLDSSFRLWEIIRFWPERDGKRIMGIFDCAVAYMNSNGPTSAEGRLFHLLADACYHRLNAVVPHDDAEFSEDWKKLWWEYRIKTFYRPELKGACVCRVCVGKKPTVEIWQWHVVQTSPIDYDLGYNILCRWCLSTLGFYKVSSQRY
jgi:hypothetical protein